MTEKRVKKALNIEKNIDRELEEIERIIKGKERSSIKYDSIRAIFTELAEEIVDAKVEGMIERLTGFWGRGVAEEYIEKEIERTKRNKKPFTVAFLDLDFLKYVNDNFGHITGTRAILEVSKIIKKEIRKSDVAFRYGGDEFLVVFYGARIKDIRNVISRMRNNVSKLLVDDRARVSLSVGLADYDGSKEITTEELLDKADKELYKAKGDRVNLNLEETKN